MPSIGLAGKPLRLKGRVRTLTDGHYRLQGPMARGLRASLGSSALFSVGGVDIAVISRHVEPFDLNTLVALGIDPGSLRFLMLKSRVHWRAGLGDLASAVIECAGTGVCTSDYTALAFNRVQRPIFPLDPNTPFEPPSE
jgi:microcystin degradation protein MlrC